MHILIIGGISRSLINFRGPLIPAMLAAGHKVTACAGEPREEVAATLKDWGVDFHPVNLARAGMNPLGDLQTCRQLYRIMREIRPDVVLAYTIKPVIWGSIAARLAHIPKTFALITGLGYAFMNQTAPRSPNPESSPFTLSTAIHCVVAVSPVSTALLIQHKRYPPRIKIYFFHFDAQCIPNLIAGIAIDQLGATTMISQELAG